MITTPSKPKETKEYIEISKEEEFILPNLSEVDNLVEEVIGDRCNIESPPLVNESNISGCGYKEGFNMKKLPGRGSEDRIINRLTQRQIKHYSANNRLLFATDNKEFMDKWVFLLRWLLHQITIQE